jgi:hypothetical protein
VNPCFNRITTRELTQCREIYSEQKGIREKVFQVSELKVRREKVSLVESGVTSSQSHFSFYGYTYTNLQKLDSNGSGAYNSRAPHFQDIPENTFLFLDELPLLSYSAQYILLSFSLSPFTL